MEGNKGLDLDLGREEKIPKPSKKDLIRTDLFVIAWVESAILIRERDGENPNPGSPLGDFWDSDPRGLP